MFLNFDKLNNLFGGNKKDENLDVSAYEQEQKELLGKLESMDEEYKQSEKDAYEYVEEVLPEEPGYEYLRYEGKSGDEIVADTTKIYRDALGSEIQALEGERDEKKRALEEQKNASAGEAERERQKAGEEAKEKKRSALNALQAQGMGRSSVFELAGQAFDEALAAQNEEISSRLSESLAATDGEIAELERRYQSEINAANIDSALALAAEIEKLQEERRKEIERVQKYNNDTARRTLDYKDDRRKAIVKQYEDIYEQEQRRAEDEAAMRDYTGAKRESYLARLDAAREFYASYPENVAAKLIKLNERELKRYLGYYLDELKEEFGA